MTLSQLPKFVIDNFTEPFRLDRTRNGVGILLYVKNNLTATLLVNYTLLEDIEALFVEVVIKIVKWLSFYSSNLNFTLQIMRKCS